MCFVKLIETSVFMNVYVCVFIGKTILDIKYSTFHFGLAILFNSIKPKKLNIICCVCSTIKLLLRLHVGSRYFSELMNVKPGKHYETQFSTIELKV